MAAASRRLAVAMMFCWYASHEIFLVNVMNLESLTSRRSSSEGGPVISSYSIADFPR